MSVTTRDQVLAAVAEHLLALPTPHPLRVAIDGIDAAGKTTFADALAPAIEHLGRRVIRASIDAFHQPRALRYRQGKDSPAGYYADSFDYQAVHSCLLRPLGPGGTRRYQTKAYDVTADAPVVAAWKKAPKDAILLLDGIFLQRPELEAAWDYVIFLSVPFDIAWRRGVERDQSPNQTAAAVTTRYLRRYLPGQRLYLQAMHPQDRAQALIDNTDPQQPRLLRLQ
jgi:uridine kinase